MLQILVRTGEEITIVCRQSVEQPIATAGSPQAQYELGLRYESGARHVLRYSKQALQWLTKVAEAGKRDATQTRAHVCTRGELELKAHAKQAPEWAAHGAAPSKEN